MQLCQVSARAAGLPAIRPRSAAPPRGSFSGAAPTLRCHPTVLSSIRPRFHPLMMASASATSTEGTATASAATRTVEFMADMSCQGCANSIAAALEPMEGIDEFSIDLANQAVKIKGSADVDAILQVIQGTSKKGRKVRLIGQGDTEVFGQDLAAKLGMDELTLSESLAAVSEFKGDYTNHGKTFGVVRFAQVTEEVAMVEATLDGLSPGPHVLAIHTYGDVSRGVEGVGGVFEGEGEGKDAQPAGFLATVEADADGHAHLPAQALSPRIKVWGIIGRAVTIHSGPEVGKTEGQVAVVARAAAAGMNYKQLCTCDGVVIWDADKQR